MDNADNWRASSKSSCMEICQDELYYKDALGDVISQLFEGPGEFFGVPYSANPQHFNLLSVFVKEGRNKLVYAGSLCKDGGLLVGDPAYDLLRILLPHVHTVTKQDFDQHLTGVKQPFTRKIRAFRVKNFEGRPEGKYFSWLELGCTKVVRIDESKLATKLNRLRIDPSSSAFRGRKDFFVIHKVCHSERLHYYRTTRYTSNVWLGKDTSAITLQIKEKTKVSQRLGVCSNINEARGFCLLKIDFNDEGHLEVSDFNVKLIPSFAVPSELCIKQDELSFIAEVMDHEYLSWLTSQLKEMRTKNIWQPAIKELYTELNSVSRKVAIKYLLETVQKFQTEEEQPIQMVDLSLAISNIPSCLEEHPLILASILRGVEIVIMQPQDSDDESPEKQIVFQPVNCQPALKLMEQLLTVLDKGVVTSSQGEAAAPLLPTEVVSLQVLFYTQMACICSPPKALNHHEEPLRSLWKKLSRTRTYLESVGLYEALHNQQKVVMCPKTSELLNILSMFFPEVD